MLNIDEIGFKFQARMQPLVTEGENSRGTFLMAFVLKDALSDTVQVSVKMSRHSLCASEALTSRRRETMNGTALWVTNWENVHEVLVV